MSENQDLESSSSDSSSPQIALSVVLEYKKTFFGKFNPWDTFLEVCSRALHSQWGEGTQPAEWKISDRYGHELPKLAKIKDVPTIHNQDTLYLSKKVADASEQNLPARIEEKIEQRL
jgi:hypothetical protein